MSLLLAVALVTIVVRFLLNKFAATILLTLALTPLGQQLGVHPGVVLLVILLTVDVWFFPYQLDVYQIAYFGTGEHSATRRAGASWPPSSSSRCWRSSSACPGGRHSGSSADRGVAVLDDGTPSA